MEDEEIQIDLGEIADAGTRIYMVLKLYLASENPKLKTYYTQWLIRAIENFEKVTGIDKAIKTESEASNESEMD